MKQEILPLVSQHSYQATTTPRPRFYKHPTFKARPGKIEESLGGSDHRGRKVPVPRYKHGHGWALTDRGSRLYILIATLYRLFVEAHLPHKTPEELQAIHMEEFTGQGGATRPQKSPITPPKRPQIPRYSRSITFGLLLGIFSRRDIARATMPHLGQ